MNVRDTRKDQVLDVDLYIDEDVTHNFAKRHLADHLMKAATSDGVDQGLQVVEGVSDEDDDETNEQVSDRKVIEHDSEIQYVFASRNNGAMGYLGLVSDFRFTIYSAYDDKLGNAEQHIVWDNNLRFDRTLRALGKLTALDFENKCSTFITATN